jgi:hypothetical protein
VYFQIKLLFSLKKKKFQDRVWSFYTISPEKEKLEVCKYKFLLHIKNLFDHFYPTNYHFPKKIFTFSTSDNI